MKHLAMSALVLAFVASRLLAEEPTNSIPIQGYKLFWSDEFDGTQLDTNKWDYRGLGKRQAAINVKDTVALDGKGNLVLTTKRVNNEIHSAMIGTQGKFETKYGYFECRVKMQKTNGQRSAFWIQTPKKMEEGVDPSISGAEIDIYECFYVQSKEAFHNLHWGGYGKGHKHVGSDAINIKGLQEGYHTFGVEWTPKEYRFFVNGEETWRTSEGVSHVDQYLILSMEVTDKQSAKIVMKKEGYEDQVLFDYVRVYKKAP